MEYFICSFHRENRCYFVCIAELFGRLWSKWQFLLIDNSRLLKNIVVWLHQMAVTFYSFERYQMTLTIKMLYQSAVFRDETMKFLKIWLIDRTIPIKMPMKTKHLNSNCLWKITTTTSAANWITHLKIWTIRVCMCWIDVSRSKQNKTVTIKFKWARSFPHFSFLATTTYENPIKMCERVWVSLSGIDFPKNRTFGTKCMCVCEYEKVRMYS